MGGHHRRRRTSLSLVQQEADVRFYSHRVLEAGGGPVLVLGAANGRVAWELTRHSTRVVGVEPSERMLATAEADRVNHPGEAGTRARFLCTDLRSLRLGERFPLVVAPQNAVGLLTSRADLDSFVTTVRVHLSPGGELAFDVLNPMPAQARIVDAPHWVEPPRPLFAPHLREARRSRSREVSSLRRWRLRLFSAAELDDALRGGGLLPRERYGHFDGKAFEPTDPIQVVVAELDPASVSPSSRRP